MKQVSVFMDVEDPINPLADDAALDLAKLFTSTEVRGSFCLTGEKCRTLLARGRKDVLDAYKPHCLGLHTDTHSQHPTTMELLETLPFEMGCEAAFSAEHKGYLAFVKAFERAPIFWGGAGNTWSPEITEALKRLEIPAYAYALTRLPDEAVHRFNGILALPQALSISEADWADDTRAEGAAARILKRIAEIDQPWIGLFVGHPTRLRYEEFWDQPYMAGRTPDEPEGVEPVSDRIYERSKANLFAFLTRLSRRVQIVGVDEAISRPWKYRKPSVSELDSFIVDTGLALRAAARWPIHHPGLDSGLIIEKTMALAGTVEIAY